MRLIDADKLIELTQKDMKYAFDNGFLDMAFEREHLIKVIRNQPTAFDTEKVVQQLEEKTDFLKDCTKYGNKNAEQQEKSYSTMMMYEVADLVDDLIEIVKQEAEQYNNKKTNADRIRSMSYEELAELFYSLINLEDKIKFCKNKTECEDILDAGKTIPDGMCKKCLVEWLHSEVEE